MPFRGEAAARLANTLRKLNYSLATHGSTMRYARLLAAGLLAVLAGETLLVRAASPTVWLEQVGLLAGVGGLAATVYVVTALLLGDHTIKELLAGSKQLDLVKVDAGW